MNQKPTYEELEKRVQELESAESEHNRISEALSESEKRFHLLYERAPLGYQSLDENGCFIEVNKAWLDTLGYSREEVIGKSFGDFLHPDWVDHFKENFPRFKAVGEVLGVEFEMVKKDGSLILVSFNGKIGKDGKGHFQQTHCILHDITESKRAEEQIRQQQYLLEKAQELGRIGTWDLDLKGNILRWTDENCRIFGVSPGSVVNYEVFIEKVHPDDREYVNKEWKAATTGKPYDIEHRLLIDGVVTWVREKADMTFDKDGVAVNATGFTQDITERKQAEKALQESEKQYRYLFDQANEGLVLMTLDRQLHKVNRAFAEMHGYTVDELKNMEIRNLDVLGERMILDHADIIRRMHAGETVRFDVEHYHKDGHRFPLAVTASMIDIEGKQYYQSFHQDITDRKQAEAEQKRLQANLINAVEIGGLGSWEHDIVNDIFTLNDYFYKIYRITFEQVGGYTISSEEYLRRFVHPDDVSFVREDMKRTNKGIDTQSGHRLEHRILFPDGSTGYMSVRVLFIKDATGKVIKSYGVNQDITERKLAEVALRESEYFFRESQRIANIGSYRLDIPSGLWVSSEVLDRIFGIGEDYPRTVPGWLELIHSDDQAMMGSYFEEEVLSCGKNFDKEYRIVRFSDGETRWVQGYGQLAFDHSGVIVSMSGTIMDITERKREAAERDKLQAQLAQAQKMDSIGRLAGGVAHDFNNMLSVILGHTELLLEGIEPDQPIYAELQEIQKAAKHSADITRQLLAFARKQTVSPKLLDLNEKVESMLRMLGRIIGEDITLNWQPGRDLACVKIDSSQVDQILANLCVNARDAITGPGKLTIETGNITLDEGYCTNHLGFVPGDYVMLAVSDNGCGMDHQTLENIFEPFFTTKGVDKGTGLGLATVYGIVKQNNGFINVYSEPSHGTSFKIYFPQQQTGAESLQNKAKDHPVEGGQETILLVEDEPAILRMTKMMLERLGYQVISARTPGEAIRLAQEFGGEIHLLLTDVVMPEMNGRDLAKNLLSLYPNLKRLFMSGYTANVIAHHGVLDKGVNFIQKPFSMETLYVKVRESLDGASVKGSYL